MIENLYLIRQSIPWARYLPNPSEWHWAGIAPSEGRMRFCFFSANQGNVLLVKGKIYWEDCSRCMMSYIRHEKNQSITRFFEWSDKVSCEFLEFRKNFAEYLKYLQMPPSQLYKGLIGPSTVRTHVGDVTLTVEGSWCGRLRRSLARTTSWLRCVRIHHADWVTLLDLLEMGIGCEHVRTIIPNHSRPPSKVVSQMWYKTKNCSFRSKISFLMKYMCFNDFNGHQSWFPNSSSPPELPKVESPHVTTSWFSCDKGGLLSTGWLQEKHVENEGCPHRTRFLLLILFYSAFNSAILPLMWIKCIDLFFPSPSPSILIDLNIYPLHKVSGSSWCSVKRWTHWTKAQKGPTSFGGAMWKLAVSESHSAKSKRWNHVKLPWIGHTQSPELQAYGPGKIYKHHALHSPFRSANCWSTTSLAASTPPCISWHLPPKLLLILLTTT